MNILCIFSVFCLILIFSDTVYGLIDGLYCGKENCYTVLGVNRESTKAEIAKMYRQLARKYHPDMHKTAEAKKEAEENFTLIATAYEVLKDDESRKDYDYMLDNPDKVYGHYYRYYRRRMSPKVDARIVIAVIITVISVIQYLGAWSRYKSAINYLITVPKYRLKAMEIAKQENLLAMNKKRNKRSKEQMKEEAEAILKKILEERMDIRGGYSKPTILDILWVQLLCLPYTIMKYVYWNLRWLWKFTIQKQEYGEEEKLYLIRKHLQCSQTQWDAIPDDEKEECFEQNLWIKENFLKWKQEKEDELKAKYAESARYKTTRRMMRNQGHRQITFDD
ncbi:dnaJ homolog subfamily C member 25 homolog [Trichonephila inaurata madagascariensis]|uniref:DnaJ homolog subfamily C member 25 homolog n=1 Tax=Trichonephila inaurata madagascariensis TaxID=2747483 RepID=A0A8X6MG15_9ARAC|nr:dnaJ homolog subfamily C member 25 homolog [Trichonephila inaurata madagascariensis]